MPEPAAAKPAPQKVETLSALRDQLGDYLAAVERNTDAVNNWLDAHKAKIILFHQRLERAFTNKDPVKAVALIAEMSDIAGFVLGLQDFRAKSETAFGKDNAFLKAVANVADSLPENLQEPLPQLAGSEETLLDLSRLEDLPVKPEDPKKWHASVSGWFNREEKNQEDRERAYRQQLRTVKAEILGLQSDRHYYIDSFMDFIADTMAPETFDENDKATDASAKMLQYQNSAHIIGLAHADYQEAVETRANAVRDAALEYAQVANALDRQDVPNIIKTIEQSIYREHTTPNSDMLKNILLTDYKACTLTELFLLHIKSRKNQAELLRAAFDIDPERMILSYEKMTGAVFEKFCQMVLDEKDPLDPTILKDVIHALHMDRKVTKEAIAFSNTLNKKTIFQRVAERFDNDLPAQAAALGALLHRGGIAVTAPDIGPAYLQLHDSLRKKDAPALTEVLNSIEKNHSALKVSALMQLCQPGASLLDKICAVSSDPHIKSVLLERGMQAGLLGELRIEGGTAAHGFTIVGSPRDKFKSLFERDILPVLDQFPVATARALIAHSFQDGDFGELRKRLTQSYGWLEKVVTSKIDDQKKTEWVAALLEPFESDVVKANILSEAARKISPYAGAAAAAEILSGIEKNLVGENIRLTPDKMLCNLPLVANIWYNSDSKMLRYTVQGQSHTLLENVPSAMAEELLALIRRRGGFVKEEGGLFNPQNIDAIHYGRNATTVSWYRVTGNLNIDAATAAQLQNRPDFLHVTDTETGEISSYNVAGICLLQKQDDGTSLLIDKYGTAHVLTGVITLHPQASLTALGADVMFNPDNASILRLNPDNHSFDFRIEGADFEKLLGHDSDEFFYAVDVKDAKTFALLETALRKAPDIHAPETAAFSNLYFNMKALGYLSLDEKSSGFYCKRYSPTNKPGFIQIDADIAKEILAGIGGKDGVIHAGNLLVHADSIDTAAYNIKEEKLQFVIGREIQEVYVDADEGIAALLPLSQKKSFDVLSRKHVVFDRYSPAIVPMDLVQLDRVTLLSYSEAQGKTHIVTKDLPVPLNLGLEDKQRLFDKLEERGLDAARRETSALLWTQCLGGELSALPGLVVRVSPMVDTKTPEVLLTQALGQVKIGAAYLPQPPACSDSLYPKGKKAEKQKSAKAAKMKKPPMP